MMNLEYESKMVQTHNELDGNIKPMKKQFEDLKMEIVNLDMQLKALSNVENHFLQQK